MAVVAHRFHDYTAAVAGAIRQSAVVGEEKPLVLKLDDGRVRGVRVAGNLTDDAHRGVGTTDVVGYGIGNFLRPLTGVG